MEIGARKLKSTPTLERVLSTLRREEAGLRRRGILHAGVFGSVARGEDTPSSDVDILVEIDYASSFSTMDLMEIEEQLASLFGRRVDVVSAGGLEQKHAGIRRDTIQAF